MKRQLLLGIDVGTSSIKAIAFTTDGDSVAAATRPCEISMPGRGRYELALESCWDALAACCAEILAAGVEPHEVAGIAVSAHAETVAPLATDGTPLRPAIVWLDGRSTQEASELRDAFGEEQLQAVSGQPRVIPMWPATKILWLEHHEPEAHAAARWWAGPLDYIYLRLTGRLLTEPSTYSSSLMLDVRSRDWWNPMLERLGARREMLPELVDAGTAVGGLSPAVAETLGLAPGTPIVMGGFDQACSALGAGNVRAGGASESTGTSMALHATIDEAPPQPGSSVPLHLHVVPERLLLNASTPTGGAAIDWFRRLLVPESSGESYARYEALAASAPPGSDGVVVLPHLAGSACPAFDPAARGVVFGVAPHHGPGHLARASIEGVAFALAEMLDAERALGASPREIHSVGGASRSDLWLQIKADVANLPFVATAVEDAGALGAAILAGVGAGIFASADEGCAAMVRQRATFEPDPAGVERYAEARAVYRELHPRLQTLFPDNRAATTEQRP